MTDQTVRRRTRLLWLVGLALLQLGISFHYAGRLAVVGDMDPSYYYACARNLALGRGLVDTIQWQFLSRHPPIVEQPVGSFWPLGWPLLLGCLMQLFGTSQQTTLYICGALSATVPLLVYWLAERVTGQQLLAGAAGLMMILLQDQDCGKITPDSNYPYVIVVMAGLCAFEWARTANSRTRWVVAGIVMALPFWFRGEGFVLGLAGCAAILGQAGGSRPIKLQRLADLASGALISLTPYVVYYLAAFGRFVPQARAAALWMTDYNDLFRFLVATSPARWMAQGLDSILAARWHTLWYRPVHGILELPWPLTVMALVGAWVGYKAYKNGLAAMGWFLALSWIVPSLLAPFLSFGRFAGLAAPMLCLLAAVGIVHLASKVPPAGRPAVGLLLFGCCIRLYWPGPTPIWDWSSYLAMPPYLALTLQSKALSLSPADLVFTSNPCEVAADLDVSTVTAPSDGVPGFYAVIAAYHPRYMIVKDGTTMAAFRELTGFAKLRLHPVLQAADATWYEFDYSSP